MTASRAVRFRLFSMVLLLSIASAQSQTNGVLREVYSNIAGSSVSDLTSASKFPNSPDEVHIDPTFEAPSNFADNYGQRMRALVLPPVTGNYVFWTSSDDSSTLYLSTDETAANKVQIADVDGWTPARAWTKFPSQKSAPISLVAGKRYYIEALQKEGSGGDNLAVGWQKPGDAPLADNDAPIPGAFLVPFGLGPPVIVVQPTNVSGLEAGAATFTVQVSQTLGMAYQWIRNGTNVLGATNSSYVISPLALTDSGAKFSCRVFNTYGSTNTVLATLTVLPDVTPPTLAGAVSIDPSLVTVIFSEPVEAATATAATNYTISDGITVLSASFGADLRTVILTVSPLSLQFSYTLTVSNVRDRAVKPNTIAPNSSRVFSFTTTPLDVAYLHPRTETAGPSSRHGPVTIDEIMYHPLSRSDGKSLEFVELFNSSPVFEDISGYRLAGTINYTFPPNTVLDGRGVLVVASVPADIKTIYGINNVIGPYTNKLSNSSGTVRLINREGGIVFEVAYSSVPPWPASADGGGHSLALSSPSLGEANPLAWSASDVIGGSPGRLETAGSNPLRTVMINELLAHTDLPDLDSIELFNYYPFSVNVGGCILTDDPTTNKFVIPANTTISPQGFLSYDETQLGFRLNAAGETVYLINPSNSRVVDCVRFGAQENGVSYGRYPDGGNDFYRLDAKTFGSKNSKPRASDVVINEIMRAPLSDLSDDQYVELYNRGSEPVDLSHWSLEDGIKYTFPHNTFIPTNGYLVVAKNAARLLTNYSNLTPANTLGNFSGSLSHSGERIALAKPDVIISTNASGKVVTNTIHIAVDEVTLGKGGRWGQWSQGGGSSLELIDPRSDHRRAPSWADSDESAKSSWTTIERTGILENGSSDAGSLQIIMLGAGECLVDNVEVTPSGGQNLLTNGTFDAGLAGWAPHGNHEDSSLEVGQGYNSTSCLHVRSTDHGDTGANCVIAPLSTALSPGQIATIRAKVRWVAGHPEILFRLHGNWLDATGNMLPPANLGTPGAPNSRAQKNAGPAIVDVKHYPVLPTASQAVTVTARVNDPDALASVVLKYRLDPSTNLVLVSMLNNGAGLYSGIIPAQAAGQLAAFYIEAMDNASPRGINRFPNDAPARECLVRWGDPVQGGNFGTYRLWMTQATFDRWSNREHLSNKPLDCTFIYGNSRVIYNMGGQYSGSPYHSPGFNNPTGNVCDYLTTFPDDDTLLGETDATLQWPGNGGGDGSCQREQTAYWIAEQMGLPYCYRRSINLFVNGQRRGSFYEDVQQPNGNMTTEFFPAGANGDLHKVQVWFEFDSSLSGFSGQGATLGNVMTSSGQKSLSFYRWTMAKRAVQVSANDYTNMFALVDAVNYPASGAPYRHQLETNLDLDNWLKTYGVEHIVGNNDSFAYGGGQNMYAYKPVGDTWKMMIWDIDFAFASEAPTNNVFSGIGRSNGIDLGEPTYLRRYWQVLQDLANGPLDSSRANTIINARYNAMIASGVTVDSPSAITDYIAQRRAYLLNLIATNVPSPFAVTLNGGAGFTTNKNYLTLSGVAPIGVRSITVNGVVIPVAWSSVSNWSAQLVLPAKTNLLTILGLNGSSNFVAGASNTMVINIPQNDPPQGKLVINEIMPSPVASNACYLELFNASTNTAFDLSGWRLSGLNYQFPPSSLIMPQSFLVLAQDSAAFAQAYGSVPVFGVYTGTLDTNGETLRLIKPGATAADDQTIAQVHYETVSPWPDPAHAVGSALQLIDPSQPNERVANWFAVPDKVTLATPTWHYFSITGPALGSTFLIFLQSAGEAYIDDIQLVAGSVAGVGTNLLHNGDFEAPLTGTWGISSTMTGSGESSSVIHGGKNSLHVVASGAGSSRATAIYQDISPTLQVGMTCTLSFWYRDSTNGLFLTARLTGSGISATVDTTLPGSQFAHMARFTPGATNSVQRSLGFLSPLWLNEILPANQNGATDRSGHHHPWAELYNSGTSNIDLTGMFLANNYSNLTQWAFPAGARIASNGFLTVWIDGNPAESTSNEWHTSFTIPPQTGSLALVSTATSGQTNILDYLNYTAIPTNQSYGASPDGSVGKRRVFFYPTPGASNNPAFEPLNVVVNEWMADNKATLADPLTPSQFDDWFELYNPGDGVVDLAGYYFGTSLTNRTKFKIPSGYAIAPHGYLLVWADGSPSLNSTNSPDLHVNFRLAKEGDAVGIFAEDGTMMDFVSFGPQATDVSEGRFPDGGSWIGAQTQPTPRSANFVALPNTPPSIGAIADQLLIEGQTLAINVTASDSDIPAQTLTFTLDPGAPTNAILNADTGLLAWRPASGQVPSTNSFTVRVTDNGTPPLSSTALFVVRVASRPKVLSVNPNPGGGYAITYATVPGKTYLVEYKDALQDAQWQQVDTGTVASTTTLTMIIDPAQGRQRFFRISAY